MDTLRDDRKTRNFQVRFAVDEYEALSRLASANGMNRAEFVRSLCKRATLAPWAFGLIEPHRNGDNET